MNDSAAPLTPHVADATSATLTPAVLSVSTDAVTDVRELLGWLDDCQQHDQDALAAVLHDQLGSSLTALAMRLALIARQSGADPKLVDQWSKANSQLSAISSTVRQVQRQLRPVALEVLGLRPALAEYLLQCGLRTNTQCTLDFAADEAAFSLADAAVLMRIIQQAFANIEHHSSARSVTLSVLHDAQHPYVVLQDDGVGFDLTAVLMRQTHGLRLMRERAAAIGMLVEIITSPGHGCQILLRHGVTGA